jgi:L-ornithine Nalpha-acyltransferase
MGRSKRTKSSDPLTQASVRVPLGLLARSALHRAVPNAISIRRKRPVRIYGQLGNLQVRLAQSRADIKQAQRLRYQVFFEEMGARPSMTAMMRRLDEDPYDAICDHLLVTDQSQATSQTPRFVRNSGSKVVGTYRLLRQEMAERGRGFYTQGEYDLAPLIERQTRDTRFLELGRSCVLEPYRTKRTVELLWHGLWTYIRENKFDVLIGCASFEGTDPQQHAMALSLLHHNSLAPAQWRCRAHAALHRRMDLISAENLDVKAALKAMPPLIKGYMRLGAYVGDGAVVDHQFGTTDVLIVMPISQINPKYFSHFGAPDELQSRIALAN